MATIIIGSGPGQGHYPLGQRTTVIGRDEALPIQVLDDKVSRKHVSVRFDPKPGAYFVLDMKSSNGTFINGRQLTGEVQLADEDEIRIGDTTLLFTTRDFPDGESALKHFKQAGQKRRGTLIQ